MSFIQEEHLDYRRFSEVDVAEITGDHIFTCKALVLPKTQQPIVHYSTAALRRKPAYPEKRYSFDVAQAEAIFDSLIGILLCFLGLGIRSCRKLRFSERVSYSMDVE